MHCKYIVKKICAADPHNKQVINKFFEKYGLEKTNLSKDGNDSLHLSDN